VGAFAFNRSSALCRDEKFVDESLKSIQIVGHMPDSSGTAKAIFIIIIALAVLAGLLTFANHIRPHP
jgi:hypothetical protein